MGKHRDMEGEVKGDGHQHWRKPKIPEPVLIVWNSPSEEDDRISVDLGSNVPIGHPRALSP